MLPIHPITEEHCRPHYGKPVFVILTNGSELVGTLSRLEGGKLVLNETEGAKAVTEALARKRRRKPAAVRSRRGKATVKENKPEVGAEPFDAFGFSGFPGGGSFGGPITLDLPQVAMLFAIV